MKKTLLLKAVGKRFGSKIVLDDLNCVFTAGKVYALLGENGTGKSTLAALISGEKKADSGTIDFQNIHTCALVHQRPLLADRLNVRDNIILGHEPVRTSLGSLFRRSRRRIADKTCRQSMHTSFNSGGFFDFIDLKKAHTSIESLLKDWNLPINQHSLVPSLNAQERFFTALACALYKNPDLLILDEPGAVLNTEQKKVLYPALKRYAAGGKIVILITHNTDDAIEYADGILILRPGHQTSYIECTHSLCTECATDKNQNRPPLTRAYIENLVFGTKDKTQKSRLPPDSTPDIRDNGKKTAETDSGADKNAPVLDIENVTCVTNEDASLHNISFKVFPASITCIYGHRESGLETLENLLTGMKELEYTGRILIGNTELNRGTSGQKKHTGNAGPALLRSHGAGIIPFNRTFRASNPALTVEQILSVYLKEGDKINSTDYAHKLIARADIHIEAQEPASSLSGGMLQRLIIEREIDTYKKLLILCEPERGLDVNASALLLKRLQQAARKGTAVLLFMRAGNAVQFDCRFRYILKGGRLYEDR